MSEENKNLVMVTCAHCGVKFFWPRPDDSRKYLRAKTHRQMPDATSGCEIFALDCLRCERPQFIEVFYEGSGGA